MFDDYQWKLLPEDYNCPGLGECFQKCCFSLYHQYMYIHCQSSDIYLFLHGTLLLFLKTHTGIDVFKTCFEHLFEPIHIGYVDKCIKCIIPFIYNKLLLVN